MQDSWYPKTRHIFHAMGHRSLEAAPQAANEYKVELQKDKKAPATINRRLAALRRVCRIAYETWEWLEYPVHQKIKLVSEKGTERQTFLEPDEVISVLDKIANEKIRLFYLVLAYTGLRPWSELLVLLPRQVRNNNIHVIKSKTKKSRTVPISPDIAKELTEALPWDFSYHDARMAWEEAREAVGHPEWRVYDLRHTFASWLAKSPDVPITVVRDLLGHSNLQVTSRYSHLATDPLRVAVGALPEINIPKNIPKNNE
jgi:Site-specific recombinase XerD